MGGGDSDLKHFFPTLIRLIDYSFPILVAKFIYNCFEKEEKSSRACL